MKVKVKKVGKLSILHTMAPSVNGNPRYAVMIDADCESIHCATRTDDKFAYSILKLDGETVEASLCFSRGRMMILDAKKIV